MNKTKKASVKPVKAITQVSYNRVRADYEAIKPKQLRAFDLRQLGYVLDARNKVAGTNYEIWMVLDEDTMREVDFCFIAFKGKVTGVCLPHSYSYYVEGGEQGGGTQ
jgi:hypothetical protein